MGLLDDLKQKADRVRADGEANMSVAAKKQAYYENTIRPALERCVNFLQELLDQLTVLDPVITGYFQVPGYKEPGIKARQSLPTLNLDSTVNVKIVLLRFSSEANNLEFSVTPAEEAETTRTFLTDVGQQFSDWPIREAGGEIVGLRFAVARMLVPGFLRFEADIANASILLKSTNVRKFGQKIERIRPEDITDKWLDHFGRYLLGECESPVNQYNGTVDKEHFQRMVDQERVQREKELAAAEQALREQEEAARLSSKLNRALGKVRQRLPGMADGKADS